MKDLVQFYLLFIFLVDSNGCEGPLEHEAFKWKRIKNTASADKQTVSCSKFEKGEKKSLWTSDAVPWTALASVRSNCHGGKIVPVKLKTDREYTSEDDSSERDTHTHTDSVWHQKAESDSGASERFCRLPAISWLWFQIRRPVSFPAFCLWADLLLLPPGINNKLLQRFKDWTFLSVSIN